MHLLRLPDKFKSRSRGTNSLHSNVGHEKRVDIIGLGGTIWEPFGCQYNNNTHTMRVKDFCLYSQDSFLVLTTLRFLYSEQYNNSHLCLEKQSVNYAAIRSGLH
jgi:hypothetical protein